MFVFKSVDAGDEAKDIAECVNKWVGASCLMDCCTTEPEGKCCTVSKASSR